MTTNKHQLTMDYNTEVSKKSEYLRNLLKPYFNDTINVFESKPENYRLRVEFRIWHEHGLHYAMTTPGEKTNRSTIIFTPQLPQATKAINLLMPKLIDEISKSEQLTKKLFQIEFLSTLSGDMLVTLIYHRQLDESWYKEAQSIANLLKINIIGRARKQKIVLSRDYVNETFIVNDTPFYYRQYEGGFTQPNGEICQLMLNWATTQAASLNLLHTDLLELYCGNGNFTLPLAQYFRKVLATEISKTSVKALKENIKLNQVHNIKVARLSAEEFDKAYKEEREFRRLKQDDIALNNYQFSTIFVDPPRAGVDSETLEMMSTFDNIIYISCNPQTLCENLESLTNTHQVVSVAMFDQFPSTKHIETGVILRKNTKKFS